jgi:DNA-directed RNA polymerase subunit beta'
MITEVDAEAREEDMPQLEKKLANDRKKIETRRDNDLDVRTKKLEADIAELESEDAKSDVKRKVRESAERELKGIRDRSERELNRLEDVWTRFKNLKECISREIWVLLQLRSA